MGRQAVYGWRRVTNFPVNLARGRGFKQSIAGILLAPSLWELERRPGGRMLNS